MLYFRLGFERTEAERRQEGPRYHRVVMIRGHWNTDKTHKRIQDCAKRLEPDRTLFAYIMITKETYYAEQVSAAK
jgi:hypothetical protein